MPGPAALAAMALALIAQPAQAQTPTAPSSPRASAALAHHAVQCFLIGGILAGNATDPELGRQDLAMMNFYSGAAFGASPNVDFTAAVLRASRQLGDRAHMTTLERACLNEYVTRDGQRRAAVTALQQDASKQAGN